VDDTIDPVLAGCPNDVTVECFSQVPAPANVTATDNCDTDVDVDFSAVTSSTFCPTTITRTWVATDDCGNTDECSQIIVVSDTTDPVLSGCPNDVTVECIEDVPAPANVTANDNCDGAITPEFSAVTSSTFCPLTITRTWTATDDCGNSDQCSQIIVVSDTTKPVLAGCPNDVPYNVSVMYLE
jgi:hypothetical protein